MFSTTGRVVTADGRPGPLCGSCISRWQQTRKDEEVGPASAFVGCSEAHGVRANPKQREQQGADAPRALTEAGGVPRGALARPPAPIFRFPCSPSQ